MSKQKFRISRLLFDVSKIVIIVLVGTICFLNIPHLFEKEANVEKKSYVVNATEKEEPQAKMGTSEENATSSSIDAFLIGNSNLYSGYNALQLYGDTGILSYGSAGPRLTMYVSYYMFKEMLTVHKPKVLILETDNFYEKNESNDLESAQLFAYQNMYPVFKDTTRWSEFQDKSYTKPEGKYDRAALHGLLFSRKKAAYTKGVYMNQTDERQERNDYNKGYLHQIVNLAKENNVKVIFLSIPCATSWNYKKHNAVQDFANEYQIPFLDLNLDADKIQLDWSSDTRDNGQHLNLNGASKVTTYLGKYLKEEYNLPDCRNNVLFSQWGTDYENYLKLFKK